MSGAAGSYFANRPIIMKLIREAQPKSILDIGVGSGYYGEMIRRDLPDVRLYGIETFDYSNYRWDCYNKIIREDARLCVYDRYDLYLMVDVIEHMSKEEGHALLAKLSGPVIMSTPWAYDQDGDENPLQAHVSRWTLADFAQYSYQDHSNYLSAILVIAGGSGDAHNS
jgi:hypothetical protein